MMRGAVTATVCAVLLAAACGDDEPAAEQRAHDGGGGSAGSAGADGGTDARAPKDRRGDPATFPATCPDDCEAACARLDECGGATSAYPLAKDECLTRCAAATKGPVWDDVSGNFRCCTAQTDCWDVATCGGWLKEPSPGDACSALCACFFGGASVPVPSDVSPPPGYQFATDAVVVRRDAERRLAVPGVKQLFGGRFAGFVVQRPSAASNAALGALGADALPTFRDRAGRVSAASGGLVLTLPTAAALAAATRIAAEAGLPAPVKLSYGKALYAVRQSDGWAALRALPRLAGIPQAQAELDFVRHVQTRALPNDPELSKQWHLSNTGQSGAIPGADGRVTEAWEITRGAPEVVIAINDDGVDVRHPDLAANALAPLNFPADWQAKADAHDLGNHGTSCAGVAAASADNALGGAGVCPGCKLLPHLLAETNGSGQFSVTDQETADGFTRQVDAGAWVISNSWGPAYGDARFDSGTLGYLPNTPQVVKAAFAHAESAGRGGKGTVILFAAGNENVPIGTYSEEPTVLSIAAVDDQGLKSYYSCFGDKIAVGAPSSGGLVGITTTSLGDDYTDQFGGTSSACPFAAGVVGLILSANPELTAAEARDILRKSATKIDPVWGGWDAQGHSKYYGSGLVNAWRAVKMAKGECADPSACLAPSDVCTGAACGQGQCGVCRVDQDCQTGFVCQALPSLGRSLCVAAAQGTCPTGTDLVNGYCIPTRATCGLCGGAEETCNGRDDDCSGEPDDGAAACSTAIKCVQAEQGCPAGQVCAATYCATECNTDDECGEGGVCLNVKDRYGTPNFLRKGCSNNGSATCAGGCEVLASSLDDTALAEFVSCMAAADCNAAFGCAQSLPVNF